MARKKTEAELERLAIKLESALDDLDHDLEEEGYHPLTEDQLNAIWDDKREAEALEMLEHIEARTEVDVSPVRRAILAYR